MTQSGTPDPQFAEICPLVLPEEIRKPVSIDLEQVKAPAAVLGGEVQKLRNHDLRMRAGKEVGHSQEDLFFRRVRRPSYLSAAVGVGNWGVRGRLWVVPNHGGKECALGRSVPPARPPPQSVL